MNQGIILYDPVPIGRLGIRKEDEEVIIVNDYSCFAQMLEEYISYGAIKIALTASSPELRTIDQMPLLLQKRIHVIDDASERETLHRIFHNIRKEFDVIINEENDYLHYPKNINRDLVLSIDQLHSNFKKIALAFNHNLQADVNIENYSKTLRYLRAKITNNESRILLAELESLTSQYENVSFDGIIPPKKGTPIELMDVFDRLINDKNYMEYSMVIQDLAIPENRNDILLTIRELARVIKSKNYILHGWDYVSKLLKVWTGVPIPDSKMIATLFKDKPLPSFVNMGDAKKQAVEMWRNSIYTNAPLRRDGKEIYDKEVVWLPILDSMKVDNNIGTISLGTVGELRIALEKVSEQMKK